MYEENMGGYIVLPSEEEDRLVDEETYYWNKIDMCGVRFRCRKPLCENCGGYGGLIHKTNFARILKRFGNLEGKFLRQFVFTVPGNLRTCFMSKGGLNSLFGITKRVIKKNFGIVAPGKKRKRREGPRFELQKNAVAILHLLGEEVIYNPHINVLLLDNRDNKMKLTEEILHEIKRSYKRALQAYTGTRLDTVSVHYAYKASKADIKKSVWYMARPTDIETWDSVSADYYDLPLSDFTSFGLTGFHFIRYWGRDF